MYVIDVLLNDSAKSIHIVRIKMHMMINQLYTIKKKKNIHTFTMIKVRGFT